MLGKTGIEYFMSAETRRSYGNYYKDIIGGLVLIRHAKTNELILAIDTVNKTCVFTDGVSKKTKTTWREWLNRHNYIEIDIVEEMED